MSSVGKLIGNNNVKLITLQPLPKFSVSELFPVAITQTWVAMSGARQIGYLYCKDGCSAAHRSKGQEKACPISFCQHCVYRYRDTPLGRRHFAPAQFYDLVTWKLPTVFYEASDRSLLGRSDKVYLTRRSHLVSQPGHQQRRLICRFHSVSAERLPRCDRGNTTT